MGATNFIHKVHGNDPYKLFEMLVSEAEREYGEDSYNGTISTCSYGNIVKRFDKYTVANEKKAMAYIDEKEGGQKWFANVIDLGVVQWEVTTIKKKTNSNSKPVYRMKYVVVQKKSYFEIEDLKGFDTKLEADNYALKEFVKHPNNNYFVEKKSVKVSGDSVSTTFEKVVKVYKTKPNLKKLDNRVIEPIHKYIIFGMAAC